MDQQPRRHRRVPLAAGSRCDRGAAVRRGDAGVRPTRGGAPILGEDNDYVYREVIGLDDEEYRGFVEAKVIVEDYLDRDMNPV